MQITELSPTLVDLPSGKRVHIRTQRWALDPWHGASDPPELQRIWSIKPKYMVNGGRSCAELAILDHLQHHGWDGVWVSAFGGQLRKAWFPAPAFTALADAGAPASATEAFGRLRAANGGKLSGFFDIYAWRDTQISFYEAKVGPDRLRDTQRRFLDTALRFHRPEAFTIIEIPA